MINDENWYLLSIKEDDMLGEIKSAEDIIQELGEVNKNLEKYINYLKEENKGLKDKNNTAIRNIEMLIETMEEQPSENKETDNYILDKLKCFIKILKGGENND
jgi:predicted RNase H-like nuclease (RuvC/YqgF family)